MHSRRVGGDQSALSPASPCTRPLRRPEKTPFTPFLPVGGSGGLRPPAAGGTLPLFSYALTRCTHDRTIFEPRRLPGAFLLQGLRRVPGRRGAGFGRLDTGRERLGLLGRGFCPGGGGHKRRAHCGRGGQGRYGAPGQRRRAGEHRHRRFHFAGGTADRRCGELHHDPGGVGGGGGERRGQTVHRGPGQAGSGGGDRGWGRRLRAGGVRGRGQGRRSGHGAAGRAHPGGRGHRGRDNGRGRVGPDRRILAARAGSRRHDPGRHAQLHRPGDGPGHQGRRGLDLWQGGEARGRGRGRQAPGRAHRRQLRQVFHAPGLGLRRPGLAP